MNRDDGVSAIIVGLGYVGLTLAVALAQRGVRVYGIERRAEVVDLTNAGKAHFSEVGLDSALESVVRSGKLSAAQTTEGIPQADYYVITVGTPLKPGTYEPRLDMIEEASREVAEHMPVGAAVILRSTVRVGTTRGVVKPVLDQAGKGYHLSMCPERTLEGDALRELALLPQIVGGVSSVAGDRAAALFSRLTHTVVRVADPETAEMIKLIDNTSRDVRFAFANEVARACDALGINAQDVIRFGKLGYSRTDVALPGLVGGPCLEKDPHILLASVAPYGVTLEISAASRLVNERQPAETVSAVVAKRGARGPGPYTVLVAGLAFKGRPETDDLRGSMSTRVIDELRRSDSVNEIRVFDSVVSAENAQTLGSDLRVFGDFYAACADADIVIIANNHPIFSAIDVQKCVSLMNKNGLIYDYWNNLSQLPPHVIGGHYFTVGNLAGQYQ